MNVHHLNCGTMCPMGARFMNDQGWLSCHCLLIESNDGLVLVDTGFGSREAADPVGRLGRMRATTMGIQQDEPDTALRQVQRLGLKVEDVRHIVLTHLDFDHAGGLADFPRAKVHVLDIEHQAAMRPSNATDKFRYAKQEFAHGVNWQVHSLRGGEKWYGLELVRPLDGIESDLLLVPLFGHSRGHCGIAVNTPMGWLLHAGDAIMDQHELDPVFPTAALLTRGFERIVADDHQALESNKLVLRDLARDHKGEIRIICSHDPSMMPAGSTAVNNGAYVS